MGNKGAFTKVLALAGTVLVWFPFFVTLIINLNGLVTFSGFLLGYLIPTELFPVGLLGTLQLAWAAFRARARLRPYGWGLAAALTGLALSQVFGGAAALALHPAGSSGPVPGLVVTGMVLYSLALFEVGVAGSLLVRDLHINGPYARS